MTRYRTIVADPPWEYPQGIALGPGHGKLRAAQPLPYPAMSLPQILALPVRDFADRDCRLFLWTTNSRLRDGFSVLDAWGFDYRQALVWHKTDVNLIGHIAPNSAEYVLVAVKGSPPRLGTIPSAVFAIPRRGGHSAKPEWLLDVAERVSPSPRLEMFARRNRLGWDTWGNEALGHVELGPVAA